MRVTYDSQLKFGQVLISDIELDIKSRDDVPRVLLGLQALFCDKEARTKIFVILEQHLSRQARLDRGRPGMELWRIFVLGVVKMALNCDFDRLHTLACSHFELRQLLGHADIFDKTKYRLQTIIDNVSLLSEEILREINAVVVACGHKRLKQASDKPLACRVDSAVTKTHVHWPTDVNLLRDAMRCLIRAIKTTCEAHNIGGWRKASYWQQQVQNTFTQVRMARQWRNPNKVAAYLAVCAKVVQKAESTAARLTKHELPTDNIRLYLGHAARQIDQIERRLLKNETIPHAEKVFSIHEPHTRWINKGKPGVKAELGLPVCFLEDQHQFILQHEVLRQGVDSDMIVPFIKQAKQRYRSITSCSMDKGYYTPANRDALDGVLALNVMPKKGGRNQADQARERAPAFVQARRRHPGIESAINHLNHCGLDRIRTHGLVGFERTVALGVVAANIHRLGQVVKTQAERYTAWHQARRKAA